MRNKRNLKEEQGITLLALIITIIILAILALITVNSAYMSGIIQFGVNGAKDYAKSAIEENEIMDTTTQYVSSVVSEIKKRLEDPNKAESKLKAGDFVKLKYKQNEGDEQEAVCMVLYDKAYNEENDTQYGIQVLSTEKFGDIQLGYDDPRILSEAPLDVQAGDEFTKALWSWNHMAEGLVDMVSSVSCEYASEVRYFRSLPDSPSARVVYLEEDAIVEDVKEYLEEPISIVSGMGNDSDQFYSISDGVFDYNLPFDTPEVHTKNYAVFMSDRLFEGGWSLYPSLSRGGDRTVGYRVVKRKFGRLWNTWC